MVDKARTIAVIGAGWAGLAAAVEATARGHAVTLIEMAPQAGGRARSVAFGGVRLDNGQHILIGAYVECLRLMSIVGVDVQSVLHRMPLCLVDPDGSGLRLGGGNALLAFARAVMSHPHWRLTERVRLLIEAAKWMSTGFRCAPESTVADLTSRLPRSVRDQLIDPLCVAALNTPSTAASASVFLRVLHDALFTAPGSSDLLLPSAPLEDAFPTPAVTWLRAGGADVRTSTRVDAIGPNGSRWWVDSADSRDEFDAIVIATTAVEAARLALPLEPAWAARAAAFSYEPIVTVYAQSDGSRLPEPMLTLQSDDFDRPAQFVFDQGRLGGPLGRLSFVVSGAATWVERGRAAVTEATLAQAALQLSKHLRSPLRHVQTLTEKRATFRCTPGLDRPHADLRPRLVAAGDYVDGPYPATLEGAMRSGVSAIDRLQFAAQRE